MIKYNLPHIEDQPRTVILANGLYPSHPIPYSILQNNEFLICCDGAINNLSSDPNNIIPNAIVGDCDSLSEENKLKYKEIIHRIAEQETNDLTKAVNYCISLGKNKITILGATGKREDHTIANISLLCEYMEYCDVEIITDNGIFNAIRQDAIFESRAKQQVSLFSLDPKPITSFNLAYPITDRIFNNWWQATLNEAIDTEFSIKTQGRVIVYRAF